jgi:hypothetical protein
LSISTPVYIALALMVMTLPQFRRARRAENIAALMLAAGMIFTSGAYAPIQRDIMGWGTLTTPIGFSANWEYVPVGTVLNPGVNELCPEVQKHATLPDSLVVPFSVTCSEPATVALPINRSPGHFVRIGDKVMLCGTQKDNPVLCAVDLPAGENYVLVYTPTVESMMVGLWYHLKAAMGETGLFAAKS